MGFLWTQKRVKTLGFLRFLNMQLFGSLKLLMALWAHLCPFLQELAFYVGPNCVSKIAFFMYQNRVFQFCKKNTKKKHWTILVSFLEHFWEQFWGPFWDQIGQRGGKMSPREPSGVQRAKKLHFQKP